MPIQIKVDKGGCTTNKEAPKQAISVCIDLQLKIHQKLKQRQQISPRAKT